MTLPYLLYRSNLKREQYNNVKSFRQEAIPLETLKGQSLRRFKPGLMFKPDIKVQRQMEKPIDAFGSLRGFMFLRGIQKRSAVRFHLGLIVINNHYNYNI